MRVEAEKGDMSNRKKSKLHNFAGQNQMQDLNKLDDELMQLNHKEEGEASSRS